MRRSICSIIQQLLSKRTPNSFSALIRVTGLAAAAGRLCFESTSVSNTCGAREQQDFHTLKQRFSEALCLDVFVDYFHSSQFSRSTAVPLRAACHNNIKAAVVNLSKFWLPLTAALTPGSSAARMVKASTSFPALSAAGTAVSY